MLLGSRKQVVLFPREDEFITAIPYINLCCLLQFVHVQYVCCQNIEYQFPVKKKKKEKKEQLFRHRFNERKEQRGRIHYA